MLWVSFIEISSSTATNGYLKANDHQENTQLTKVELETEQDCQLFLGLMSVKFKNI